MSMVHRVVAKFLAAQESRKDSVPVRNKDTGRIVYVLPSTLKENGSRFNRVSPEESEPEELTDRQPRRPQKPRKPRRPTRHRVPFPIPEPYDKPPQPPKLVRRVKPVKPVKPVPVPKPPKPRRTPLVPGRARYKK